MNSSEQLEEILQMRKEMEGFFGPYVIYPSPTILLDVTLEQLEAYFNE